MYLNRLEKEIRSKAMPRDFMEKHARRMARTKSSLIKGKILTRKNLDNTLFGAFMGRA